MAIEILDYVNDISSLGCDDIIYFGLAAQKPGAKIETLDVNVDQGSDDERTESFVVVYRFTEAPSGNGSDELADAVRKAFEGS